METNGSNPGPQDWRLRLNVEPKTWFYTMPCCMPRPRQCPSGCEGLKHVGKTTIRNPRDRLSHDKATVTTQVKCFRDAKDRLSHDKATMTSHDKATMTTQGFAKSGIDDSRKSPKREGWISFLSCPKRKSEERKFQNDAGTRKIDPEREGIRMTEMRRPESPKEGEREGTRKQSRNTRMPRRCEVRFSGDQNNHRLTDPNVYEQEQQNDEDEQARKQKQIGEEQKQVPVEQQVRAILRKAEQEQQQREFNKTPHTSISLKQHNLLLDALSHRNKQIAYALARKEDMLLMKNIFSTWYSVSLGTRRCSVRIGLDATNCMNLLTTNSKLKRREYRQVVNGDKDKDRKEDNDNEDKGKENVMKSDNNEKADTYIPHVSTVPKSGQGWIIDLPSSRAGFETDSASPPVFYFDICTEGSLRKRSCVAWSVLLDLEKLKLLKFYTPTKQSLGLYPYNEDVPLASEHQRVGSIKITCEKMMCFEGKNISGIGEQEEACQEAELRRVRELLKEQEVQTREATDQAHRNETRFLRDMQLELDKMRRQKIEELDMRKKIEELELELDMRKKIEKMQRENEREMECGRIEREWEKREGRLKERYKAQIRSWRTKSAIDEVKKEQFLKFFDERCCIRKELYASSPTCSDEDVNFNWRKEATLDGTFM